MNGIGHYIREQREAAKISVRQLAASAGVSNPYLSQVERGLRKPSAEMLGRIAGALRISAESLYVRAGILEPQAGDLDVLQAIAADATITETQRHALLEVYRTFQDANAMTRAAALPRSEVDSASEGYAEPTSATPNEQSQNHPNP